ncbi:metal-dependent transcriptional regulator [Puniceicoccaceae bacterium K14]|nr:metal-dependent transcriptional regulator [Puniceicoccaceae bacterium K14]
MASSTVENYIKKIYTLQHDKGDGGTVAMGELASVLGVAPGTATSMVKSLAKTGLVSYVPRVGVELTEEGVQLALLVLRRHRLVELLLVEVLGMEWHEIHEEAEALEHAISDRLLEKIDEKLNHPKLDPHGDPIPSANGVIASRSLVNLDGCGVGKRVRIGRVENQEDDFLKYLDANSLVPGKELTVKSKDVHAGVLWIEFPGGNEMSLGMPVAQKIGVEYCD